MAIGRGGYVGLVRTADGNLNVARGCRSASLRYRRRSRRARLTGFCAKPGCRRLTARRGACLSRHSPADPQQPAIRLGAIFLLGDAAGYVEPFTGEGMGWAWRRPWRSVPYVHAY